MAWKRKVSGGFLAMLGFMLSPLSWWNDAFVNLPLALGFAWIVSLFSPKAFGPACVIGYWLTNVLGFMLMHKGVRTIRQEPAPLLRRELLKDVVVSLAYTLVILILLKFGVLKPIAHYLPGE